MIKQRCFLIKSVQLDFNLPIKKYCRNAILFLAESLRDGVKLVFES